MLGRALSKASKLISLGMLDEAIELDIIGCLVLLRLIRAVRMSVKLARKKKDDTHSSATA